MLIRLEVTNLIKSLKYFVRPLGVLFVPFHLPHCGLLLQTDHTSEQKWEVNFEQLRASYGKAELFTKKTLQRAASAAKS